MTKPASLIQVFEGALKEIQARFFISAQPPSSIAIAYSGGLDSAALLHLAHDYATRNSITLFAFHVHHGISSNADAWLAHCGQEAAGLNIHFDSRYISLDSSDKNGIEEAARIQRYAALGKMCEAHKVPLLLTAHHEDDQAETVLLQLLRGSGVAGLSGMDAANTAPKLLKHADLVMARPLLSVSRADLAHFVERQKIAYVEDESNIDPRYARNALRHEVMPSLEKYFPGFQKRFARTAQHAQSAQRLLIELASQDLSLCQQGDCLDVNEVKKLSEDRSYNLLRYWFGVRGMRMPSTAWLIELRSQLFEAKEDAQLCVTHPDCHLRRYRDRIYITPKFDAIDTELPPLSFSWQGESGIHFPRFHGTLYFEDAEQGIAADWLREHNLQIRLRQGGERLKLANNRPTKSLKYHYQAFDVPAWERERLPMICSGTDLLFAAGIGLDCHHLSEKNEKKIQFRWQFD